MYGLVDTSRRISFPPVGVGAADAAAGSGARRGIPSGDPGTAVSEVEAFSPFLPRLMADELGWDALNSVACEFLTDLPGALMGLQEHLSAGKRQELHRGAHSLKGICLTLGLDGLADALRRIEAAATTSDPDGLARLIGELSAPAANGERALCEWLRAGRSEDGRAVAADCREERAVRASFHWTGQHPGP